MVVAVWKKRKRLKEINEHNNSIGIGHNRTDCTNRPHKHNHGLVSHRQTLPVHYGDCPRGRINTLGNDHVRGYPFIRQDDSRDVRADCMYFSYFFNESGKVTDIKCGTLHGTNPG